ncbi:MAG: ester cyclase [Chloroflexi bacterium]|nr:ester cyclase [Chloroflexota bacterium]
MTLKTIATRWIEEIWRPGDLATFFELHAAQFADRSPSDRPADREAYRQSILDLYAAFPDFFTVIDDLVCDEAAGKAAIRWTATGTHQGAFMGIEPTGRVITFHGIEIIRVVEDRIVERWGEWDGLVIYAQLTSSDALR